MLHTIYFIYGLCVMFYFMMSWLFFHKDKELLSRLVAVLMLVIGVQCLKNLYFIKPINDPNEIRWMMTIASDVVAIPLYAFILIELCSPTSLTRRTIIVHELLFIAPFVLFILTKMSYSITLRCSKHSLMAFILRYGESSPFPDTTEN